MSPPRHAVCCQVLNLLSQVGNRPPEFALAGSPSRFAYRSLWLRLAPV